MIQPQKRHKLPVHSTTLARSSVRQLTGSGRLTVFWKLAISLEIASLICHVPACAEGTHQQQLKHVKALVRGQPAGTIATREARLAHHKSSVVAVPVTRLAEKEAC